MAYKIEFRPLATIEIIEAYDWYELQRTGLGQEFLSELENFNTSLLFNPFAYSYYDEPVRQGKINRFPYVVVYEVVENSIVIYSVFMTKRDPGEKRSE
jgi:hypothetical protein